MKRAGACLIWLLLVCALPGFAAAQDTHEHQFVIETETPASCLEEGARVSRCACGETKTEVLPALGHDFALTWTVDREPTCHQTGLKSRHCTRCDAVTDLLSIRQTNHDFTVVTVEPTCTTPGCRHLTCKICGDEMTDNVTPALGHDPGLWVVEREAGCETEGLRSRSCKRCGEPMESLPIAPTGHAWRDTVTPPTCTEQGYTLHVCRACGAEKKDRFVKATGHTFADDGLVTKEPTCTEKGERRLICTVCGQPQTKAIPALGHQYSAVPTVDRAPTCTAKGEQSFHCLRCGARRDVTPLERTEHSPQLSDVAPTCTKAGAAGRLVCCVCGKQLDPGTVVPAYGHNYIRTGVEKQPTCTAQGSETLTCTRCGSAKTQALPALGHQYAESFTVDRPSTCTAQGEQSRHCLRCGKRTDVTAVPKAPHQAAYDVVTPPTCTKAGKSSGAHCAVCGKVLADAGTIPPTGHDPVATEIYSRPTCTAAGRALGCCRTCGAQQEMTLPPLGHSFESDWTIDKQPTCTAKGEQSHHCLRCGKRTDVTPLERTPHTVVTDRAKKATCTRDGRTEGCRCSVCGKVLQAQTVIKAPGHKLKTTRTPATTKQNGKLVKTCLRCGKVVSKEKIPRVKSCALSKTRFAYDGKRKTPAVEIRDKKGALLREKRDYTLRYEKGRKQFGVWSVTVVFRRNYSGEKTLRFQIVPRRPVGLDAAQTPTSVTLSWEKVKGATGYAVYERIGRQYKKLCETEGLFVRLKNRASGQRCRFAVCALRALPDGRVLRSDPSAEKLTATKPAPLTLSVSRSAGCAVLRWNNAGDCEYEIWCAPKKNGRFLCIGTTRGTSFTAGPYPRGTRACFKVKACVRSDTGTLSTQISDVRQIWL
ncbi:MAG: hypothetical protein II804_07845 [Clostridia bacterium]|nr:hypothetical protein [Clostridia bacterium]